MVTINVYQPGKMDFVIPFPSEWNDLTHQDVIYVAKLLLNNTADQPTEIKGQLLKYWIEKSAKENKKHLPEAWYLQLDPDQVFCEVLPFMDFIFKVNGLTNTPPPISLSLSGVGGKEFYPVPFDKITCGEFEDAERFANQFLQSDSKEDLANMTAILFRPLRRSFLPSGGRGVVPYMIFNYRTNDYSTYAADKKVKYFLKLSPENLYATFIWYAGCRSQLPVMFPDVYDSSGEPDIMSFTRCIHSAAGPKNGSREKIRITNLYEFMFEMNEEARKAKELEAQYAQLNQT